LEEKELEKVQEQLGLGELPPPPPKKQKRELQTWKANHNPETNYFKKLQQTPEGRAIWASYVARRGAPGTKPLGRKKGAKQGYSSHEVLKIREKAKKEAEIIMSKLEQTHELPDSDAAKEALNTAITIMRAECETTKDRLAAAKTILEFTKTKPAAKSEVSISKAEDFLAAILAKDNEGK
jgi:hypothetical protein